MEAGRAAYEAERREATARIVLMNRAQGPDKVMDLAQDRAPNPGDDLDARLPMSVRAAIAAEYKRVAGFDPAALNAKAGADYRPAPVSASCSSSMVRLASGRASSRALGIGSPLSSDRP